MRALPFLTLLALGAAAQDAPSAKLPPEHVEFFEKKIRPVLVDRCYRCHSAQSGKSKGGLFVDTREALLKGGDSGILHRSGRIGFREFEFFNNVR